MKLTAGNTPKGMTTGSLAHRVHLRLIDLEYHALMEGPQGADLPYYDARVMLINLWK